MATKQKVSKEIIHAIGRRKTSVARVYMKPGKGEVSVNGKPLNDYFGSTTVYPSIVLRPFQVLDLSGQFDVVVTAKGGGLNGQSDATSLAIARALCALELKNNPLLATEEVEEAEEGEVAKPKTWRDVLKTNQLLTRIDKKVERKKYGYRKARKKEQYSKR